MLNQQNPVVATGPVRCRPVRTLSHATMELANDDCRQGAKV